MNTEPFHVFTSISTQQKRPADDLPHASDDILFARLQGAEAFQLSMLSDPGASARCCCYSQPLYREAFHYGFHHKGIHELEMLVFDVTRFLREPFMVHKSWYSRVEVAT